MKINDIKLVKTIYGKNDTYPPPLSGEYAFVGRSNVGKSTLLNILMNRNMAKVSKKPGKTRSINFYLINNKFYFVDLPGYGYAKASISERERWKKIIENYFKSRKWNIKILFVLIDGRHELQKNDKVLIEWLKSLEIPFCVVLTKMDKLKNSERKGSVKYYQNILKEFGEYIIIPYSSVTKEGVEEILELIETFGGV
ncbi:YihA family ribosome biogenesis GTP-binding protein [Thermosipho ferrireducens]|uniref:Probable GTP-binding protein EngB n=1 Tax=Thermosipho ferrireducens TaxID=2571116 RepID=A0ABX7S884_9BACT|nr:ribosome biogenesis GTP-binding protein YihA/YsxC [Thermosipho ferrireducens]QTA37832.1 YihA family ribosome biogenesis GTP-binding protein [Thermosipho ferrireducens]